MIKSFGNSESELDLIVPPGNRFEHLSGDLREYCSIRINDRWRIIFKIIDKEIYDVQIVDYHK